MKLLFASLCMCSVIAAPPPLPPRSARMPLARPAIESAYPPEAPVIANLSLAADGTLVCWTVHGPQPQGQLDAHARFEIERTATNVTVRSLAPWQLGWPITFLAAPQISRYAWLDAGWTNAATYRVRGFSLATGDPSPWSAAVSTTNHTLASTTLYYTLLPPSPAVVAPGFKLQRSYDLVHWEEILHSAVPPCNCLFLDCTTSNNAAFYRIQ